MRDETVWAYRLLSVLRIMAALLLLQHGTGKLLGFPAIPAPPPMTASWYAGFFELIGGVLLLVGLFTAVAYFMAHAPGGFFPIVNRGELAVLYCFVFFYLAFAGGGPWSVDAALRRQGRMLPAWV